MKYILKKELINKLENFYDEANHYFGSENIVRQTAEQLPNKISKDIFINDFIDNLYYDTHYMYVHLLKFADNIFN